MLNKYLHSLFEKLIILIRKKLNKLLINNIISYLIFLFDFIKLNIF